ncbi:hypothetical protein LOAG_03491 [Loa loa]|uniref:Uncharacterized protein n=1 Tax=Loa loa TaxID=7209 RepID=A0A1S0U4K0_LOALO|nr:hypothetical protein LOAG_03491 [Loa loa]EFO24997.1 hypothetical protein LOAG_03491 [Loa loa]
MELNEGIQNFEALGLTAEVVDHYFINNHYFINTVLRLGEAAFDKEYNYGMYI